MSIGSLIPSNVQSLPIEVTTPITLGVLSNAQLDIPLLGTTTTLSLGNYAILIGLSGVSSTLTAENFAAFGYNRGQWGVWSSYTTLVTEGNKVFSRVRETNISAPDHNVRSVSNIDRFKTNSNGVYVEGTVVILTGTTSTLSSGSVQ